MKYSLIFCLVIALLLVSCVIALVAVLKRMQSMQSETEERINQLVELNTRLRANRHDYLNNMQIVYGMVELGEYEELREYLEPMYKDIMKTSKALKTAVPALNALLMAKMSEAEDRGIDFYLEVKSSLKEFDISDWELCRILSNLIDNALRAVSEAEIEDKRVIVDIAESDREYLFRVSDNGTAIPDADKENIFKQGFTTKSGKGHGMGLYIVSKLVEKNKGSVKLITGETEKCFEVAFEKPVDCKMGERRGAE